MFARRASLAIVFLWFLVASVAGAAPTSSATNEIRGHVREPDVIVFLCDQASGAPVDAETFRPFIEKKSFPPKLVSVVSDRRGLFTFTNVPPGNYRLVAQKWTGPFKGLFELHGEVIHLFGVANNVEVPSPNLSNVITLNPPGDAVLIIDLEIANSGPLVALSTEPMLADPILAFNAPGTNFFSHVIGVNVMTYGRTTVIGAPRGLVHAWFFANDNSPGFTSASYNLADGIYRAPAIPFVAGWSNGRKDPPERLKALRERLEKLGTTPHQLLEIDEDAGRTAVQAKRQSLNATLAELVPLSDGSSATVADLLALILYENLKR